MMKPLSFLILILSCFSFSQEKTGTIPVEEEKFYHSELDRYHARYTADRMGIVADDNVDIAYYKIKLDIHTDPGSIEGEVSVHGSFL